MQHASTGAAERNPRAQTFPKLNMYGFFFTAFYLEACASVAHCRSLYSYTQRRHRRSRHYTAARTYLHIWSHVTTPLLSMDWARNAQVSMAVSLLDSRATAQARPASAKVP